MILKLYSKVISNEINKRIAIGSIWSILGSTLPKILSVVVTMFLTRILGDVQFGQLSLVRSTINMFTVFAVVGLGLTATKYIAENKTNKLRLSKIITLAKTFSIFSSFIISLLLYIFSENICNSIIHSPGLIDEVKLGSIMLFFNGIYASQNGILTGFEKFKSIAINNIIASIISSPLEIILSHRFGIMGALVGFSVYFFLLYILNSISIKKLFLIEKISYNYNFLSEIQILFKFTLPTAISGFIVAPVTWIILAFLANKSNGYTEIALFEVANQWRTAVLFIPIALSQIILPMMVGEMQNNEKYIEIFRKNLILNAAISFSIAISVIILGPFLLKLYGSNYNSSYPVLIVLMLSTILVAVNNVVGQIIASKSKMWLGLLFNVLWVIFLTAISYWLIDMGLGALGLAIAYLSSYIFHTILQFSYAYKFIK